MTERPAATGGDIFTPPVVVRPPTRGAKPYRRVEIYGRTVGRAYGEADVAEFIRRAGVPEPDLDDPGLVGWRGGDRTVWSADGPPTDGSATDGPASDAPPTDGSPADGPASDAPATDGAPTDGGRAEQAPGGEAQADGAPAG